VEPDQEVHRVRREPESRVQEDAPDRIALAVRKGDHGLLAHAHRATELRELDVTRPSIGIGGSSPLDLGLDVVEKPVVDLDHAEVVAEVIPHVALGAADLGVALFRVEVDPAHVFFAFAL
jgi:hypothetical protein